MPRRLCWVSSVQEWVSSLVQRQGIAPGTPHTMIAGVVWELINKELANLFQASSDEVGMTSS